MTDDGDRLLLALLTVGIVVAVGFEFGNDVDDDGVGVSPVDDDVVVFAPTVAFVVVAVGVAAVPCTPVTFTLENEVKAALFPHSYLAVILF
jgi:hypothetical protein